jgi:predicted NAD-dependent protein-ADP-ribosyltransferase YbiA (DUF1768 family)
MKAEMFANGQMTIQLSGLSLDTIFTSQFPNAMASLGRRLFGFALHDFKNRKTQVQVGAISRTCRLMRVDIRFLLRC